MFKTIFRSYSNDRVLKIADKFYNRNPRNLELLRYQRRIEGWELQFPTKSYYLKCQLLSNKSDSHAVVKNPSGKIFIEVSTKEPEIQKKLFSSTDICAVENLGRILAQRCLQSGVLSMFLDRLEYSKQSPKIKAFCDAIENGGVSLIESDLVEEPCQLGVDYDSISEEERKIITNTNLVDVLKTTNDNNKKSFYLTGMKYNAEEKKESRKFSYEKVSKGMWWNHYYNRLIHPYDLPHWDDNAVCNKKPVMVDDYLPELDVRYKLDDKDMK